MKERVLVSPELEGIVDKENILGTEDFVDGNTAAVYQEEKRIIGKLEKISIKKEKTSVSITVKSSDVPTALGFLEKSEKEIHIGDSKVIPVSSDCIDSVSLFSKKDMYIWKIIIDNSE